MEQLWCQHTANPSQLPQIRVLLLWHHSSCRNPLSRPGYFPLPAQVFSVCGESGWEWHSNLPSEWGLKPQAGTSTASSTLGLFPSLSLGSKERGGLVLCSPFREDVFQRAVWAGNCNVRCYPQGRMWCQDWEWAGCGKLNLPSFIHQNTNVLTKAHFGSSEVFPIHYLQLLLWQSCQADFAFVMFSDFSKITSFYEECK